MCLVLGLFVRVCVSIATYLYGLASSGGVIGRIQYRLLAQGHALTDRLALLQRRREMRDDQRRGKVRVICVYVCCV